MALCVYNPAVVAASYRTRVLHSEEVLLAVQNSKLGSAGKHSRIVYAQQRRGADGARGTVTKSLSMSRSVSNGVGASDFIHVDDPEVRSHPRRTATFL